MSTETETLKSFMATLAAESAKIIMPYFASPDLVVESKSDMTPVTAADKGAEALMRRMIMDRYPQHGILGEEFGDYQPGASYRWILDPVDGTKSFAANNAQFGTLIGLLRDGEPMLGAINLPASGQLLMGDGQSATLNGRILKAKPPGPLSRAIVVTTELDDPAATHGAQGWDALRRATRKLYTWGDCYGYYLAATGGVQVACDAIMSAWDLLPLIPVMRGAGLTVTDWQGKAPETGTSCVAAHPDMHGEVIRLLNPR
ncbi:MAG: inositol monophosphatase family protein [Opitutales bacterium]|jgi:myo-inositol-1(or 4)-monophosphatase